MKEVFEMPVSLSRGFGIFPSIRARAGAAGYLLSLCAEAAFTFASQGVVRANIVRSFSRPRRGFGVTQNPRTFLPLARPISIGCSWKVTYREGK